MFYQPFLQARTKNGICKEHATITLSVGDLTDVGVWFFLGFVYFRLGEGSPFLYNVSEFGSCGLSGFDLAASSGTAVRQTRALAPTGHHHSLSSDSPPEAMANFISHKCITQFFHTEFSEFSDIFLMMSIVIKILLMPRSMCWYLEEINPSY